MTFADILSTVQSMFVHAYHVLLDNPDTAGIFLGLLVFLILIVLFYRRRRNVWHSRYLESDKRRKTFESALFAIFKTGYETTDDVIGALRDFKTLKGTNDQLRSILDGQKRMTNEVAASILDTLNKSDKIIQRAGPTKVVEVERTVKVPVNEKVVPGDIPYVAVNWFSVLKWASHEGMWDTPRSEPGEDSADSYVFLPWIKSVSEKFTVGGVAYTYAQADPDDVGRYVSLDDDIDIVTELSWTHPLLGDLTLYNLGDDEYNHLFVIEEDYYELEGGDISELPPARRAAIRQALTSFYLYRNPQPKPLLHN